MFDLGWDEMALIAVVALLVLGPKELPNALRTASTWMRAARKLAGEFQSGVNDIIKEADLEDARKQLQAVNKQSIQQAIEKTVDPTGEMKSTFKLDEPAAAPAPDATAPQTTAPGIAAAPSDGPTLGPPTETTTLPAAGSGVEAGLAVAEPSVVPPIPESTAAEKS